MAYNHRIKADIASATAPAMLIPTVDRDDAVHAARNLELFLSNADLGEVMQAN